MSLSKCPASALSGAKRSDPPLSAGSLNAGDLLYTVVRSSCNSVWCSEPINWEYLKVSAVTQSNPLGCSRAVGRRPHQPPPIPGFSLAHLSCRCFFTRTLRRGSAIRGSLFSRQVPAFSNESANPLGRREPVTVLLRSWLPLQQPGPSWRGSGALSPTSGRASGEV